MPEGMHVAIHGCNNSGLLVVAVLQEVGVDDKYWKYMLCPPARLYQCRIIMNTQTLQQTTHLHWVIQANEEVLIQPVRVLSATCCTSGQLW